MEKPLSDRLRTSFLVHGIISVILGIALFLVPGRTLTFLGWVPETVTVTDMGISAPGTIFVDPVLARLLGAALLALAWSSFRGWRAHKWSEVEIVVQLEAVLCVLGVVAFVAGFILMDRPMPSIGYVFMLILALFSVVWGLALGRKSEDIASLRQNR
jgi:uncharacterized membrane protein HdeD (DUF308 family)